MSARKGHLGGYVGEGVGGAAACRENVNWEIGMERCALYGGAC